MENDVIEALADIGYEGPLKDGVAFEKAIEAGPKSQDYMDLVCTLAGELRILCSLEESLSKPSGPDESSHFLLELSSFLKELECPYLCFVTGHMSSRLQKKSERILLLDYMISELMAARMLAVDRPQDMSSAMEVTIQETPTAKDLNDILSALKMSQPPPNITAKLLFQKLREKLKLALQQEGSDYAGKPLYNQSLTEKQWKQVEDMHHQMVDEYRLRREMLITRLDCTIQSFEWKANGRDRGKNMNENIQAVYRPLRQKMRVHSAIKLSDFLAARSSLLAVKKTSDAAVRLNTKSEVNRVLIGRVPDRGGRPSEQQPPPPEMPSWQQQRSQGGGRGGGGGGGGRGGGSGFGGPGGRVQGGWNPPTGDQRGGHRGGRGGQGGQGFQQDNKSNYQDMTRGYQGGGNNRGGFSNDGNRGGYNSNNRGGYSDNSNNRGGYSDNSNNRGGYSDNSNNRGGYSDNSNRGGYKDNSNNRGGYNDNRRGSSDNRTDYSDSRGGYDNRGNRGYQGD